MNNSKNVFPYSLAEKEILMKSIFKNDDSFVIKALHGHAGNLLCKLCFIDGISDDYNISQMIIEPMKEINSLNNIITTPKYTVETDINKAISALLTGNVILLIDNSNDVYVVDVKKVSVRGISEPENEKVIKGAKDGFIENVLVNMALLRGHIKNTHLKFEYLQLEGIDHNRLVITYLDDAVDYEVLELLKAKLNSLKNSNGLNINIIREKLQDHKYSPLKLIGDTERPDYLAFKLLEGKVGLMIDGSPNVLVVPFLFNENLQAVDDYYVNYVFASINRIIRLLSFFLTISIPGLYVSFIMHHQELIPTKLAISIVAAREGVPLPAAIECFLLLFMFEILREAASKSSSSLGTSISIVGALIIGQATVEARIVSTAVVIIIAITSLTGLMTPKLSGAALVFRLVLLLLSCVLGIQGLICGEIIVLIYLISLNSFGYLYFNNLFSFDLNKLTKSYIRKPFTEE